MANQEIKNLEDLKGKIKPLHIVIIVVFIAVVCFFSWGGGRSVNDKYKSWVKTEAVVDSVWANSRIGKGQGDIWIISFTDEKGNTYRRETSQTTTLSKKVGDKVTIYYDPQDPNTCYGEDTFNEIKYQD